MRHLWGVLLATALVACEQIGAGGAVSAADSITTLNAQLAEARTVAAQQDSLLQGFTETTRLLEEIDKELSTVKGLKSHVPLNVQGEVGSDPKSAHRASMLGKVQEVTKLLQQNRARVASLSRENKAMAARAGEFESTIASLEQIVERQKVEIAALTFRVDSITMENNILASEKAAVSDTLAGIRTEAATVYYVVGTKDDLKKRGIIVEEGSKFLFFGKKALVPARNLDPSAFTAIDMRENPPISLHVTDKPFKVISRHDATLIEAEKTPEGQFTGTLRIQAPETFWVPSKYLIIVEG